MLSARTPVGRLAIQVLLTFMVLPFLFPLVAMVQGSLAGVGWSNYATVLAVPELPLFFRNSIIVTVITIAIVYALTMLAAFGFSKLHIRDKEVLFWMRLAALTLPGVVLLAPCSRRRQRSTCPIPTGR